MNTKLIVRTGFASVPYLIRQKQWEQAAAMLELAFNRDPSRANAAAMLPFVRKIADNLDSATLISAIVTEVIDPAAAETQVRSYLATAVARRDYRSALVAAGRLAYRCLHSGRLTEALTFADQEVSYAQQAGVGPRSPEAGEVGAR